MSLRYLEMGDDDHNHEYDDDSMQSYLGEERAWPRISRRRGSMDARQREMIREGFRNSRAGLLYALEYFL
jgi:hypothetical protein